LCRLREKGEKLMKRLLALVATAALMVLVLAVVNGVAYPGSSPGKTIHVVEHATTDTVTDLGPAGDSAGDLLTFANEIFDAADVHKVGTDQGYCVRTEAGKSWECNFTTFLAKGQITIEGPFFDADDSTFAITGGTRAYRNARGSMELKAKSDQQERRCQPARRALGERRRCAARPRSP
jgi:Allene oxide cyclase